MKIVTKEDWDQAIAEGRARQVHLFPPENLLMPRGSMKKESLALYILERLTSSYEYWTDPKYADNPEKAELLELLYTNLMNETVNAWEEFLKTIGVPNEKT